MPKNNDIKKVLLIGSGPIVIGQAAEFDYAGVQACRALKEEGVEIVLVNSNPATIMTDHIMADKIYIEPLTLTTIERIIEEEKPDSILSGLGGQTSLTLCMQLAHSGFLESHNVKLLGSSPETIDRAEDRQLFKDTMESINQPCIPSEVVTTVEAALDFAEKIGYPVIVRPAFTLGGSGGGIASTKSELIETATNGLKQSPITQILVEKCVSGWKEIEFEVMRDHIGNAITVCSMENFDPVGVHTGDSIVIAPTVTLADKEYQMLRSAALKIIDALNIEGGCNCQFALNPDSFEYAVIEVNPRVSRSSALASKATGYPIAKVATKIALGYNLDEIKNAVTGTTYAAFEPAIDYVAVKFPKWPFEKFVYASRSLGTQMKATGEVMSISDSFESAIMKAVRGAELGFETLHVKTVSDLSDEELIKSLNEPTDLRLFLVYEALYRGHSVDELFEITRIDRWFLYKLLKLVSYEHLVADYSVTLDDYEEGKKLGFTDSALISIASKNPANSAKLIKLTRQNHAKPTYKMVDTCSGEFAATTPYFYATINSSDAGGENEVLPLLENASNSKGTIIVLGSGPIRIGQGIEFDYASVHCVRSLRALGYTVVTINNNPETVSTDFDISDRLYFEPLCPEDVLNIIDIEKPVGVVVAFGGQTSIKLTKVLSSKGINIIGTSADSIDMAEDRERFDELLSKLDIKRANAHTVMTLEEALQAANDLTYPVLLRPSYVIGGQNMTIARSDDDVTEYMRIILEHEIDNPVLIDKYIEGMEIEVDSIYDGTDLLLPGIMQHIERTGIHSGDSIAVYPALDVTPEIEEKIVTTTRKLCEGLDAIGIVNVQYIVKDGEIYVIEVNPRASRTVPYLSKVTGIPMVDLAIKVSLGIKLKDMEFGTGLYRKPDYVAVKVPVFSFQKLSGLDTQLGPEMKSTGEVLGIGKDLTEALYKGFIAAGYNLRRDGNVFISVKDSDKIEIAEIAKEFASLGFNIYATDGTAEVLEQNGVKATIVTRMPTDGSMSAMQMIDEGNLSYIISTSSKGRLPERESVKLRRRASVAGTFCLTSLDTAAAVLKCLYSDLAEDKTVLVDINTL